MLSFSRYVENAKELSDDLLCILSRTFTIFHSILHDLGLVRKNSVKESIRGRELIERCTMLVKYVEDERGEMSDEEHKII